MASLPSSENEPTSLAANKIPVGADEIAGTPDNPKDKLAYAVQLGAFSNIENAAVSHALWRSREYDVYVAEITDTDGETRYVVRTGAFQNKSDASALAVTFKHKEDVSATVVQTAVDKTGAPEFVDISKLSPQSQKITSLIAAEASDVQKNASTDTSHEPFALHGGDKAKPAYSIQLGAFSTEENAFKAQTQWHSRGYDVFICEIKDAEHRTRYAVRTGLFTQPREASVILRSLKRKEGVRATLVNAVADTADKPAVANNRHLPEMTNEAAFHSPA